MNGGVYWDIVADFDVKEEHRADGQSACRWCEGGRAYPSRAALWKAHVFEPMLSWINALNANQWVCPYSNPHVTCWGARRVSVHDLETHDYVDAFPLLTQTAVDH